VGTDAQLMSRNDVEPPGAQCDATIGGDTRHRTVSTANQRLSDRHDPFGSLFLQTVSSLTASKWCLLRDWPTLSTAGPLASGVRRQPRRHSNARRDVTATSVVLPTRKQRLVCQGMCGHNDLVNAPLSWSPPATTQSDAGGPAYAV